MMQNNQIPYIIFGSSRSFGDTRKAVDLVVKDKPYRIIDLNDLSISYYDYEHANKNDDFIPLIKNMLNHQKWVFATPVYWYTMSATMKTFLDRMTDLLTIEKILGRQLRGKDTYVITCDGGERTKSFEEIFQKTFEYLGMNYKGTLFYYSGTDPEIFAQNRGKIVQFKKSLYG